MLVYCTILQSKLVFCIVGTPCSLSVCFRTHQGERVASAVPIIPRKLTFRLWWRDAPLNKENEKTKRGKASSCQSVCIGKAIGERCQRPSIFGETKVLTIRGERRKCFFTTIDTLLVPGSAIGIIWLFTEGCFLKSCITIKTNVNDTKINLKNIRIDILS